MKDIGVYVADFFAFLSWLATVRGNGTILKSHSRFAVALSAVLNAVKEVTTNVGSKSGSDSGSGSSSSGS